VKDFLHGAASKGGNRPDVSRARVSRETQGRPDAGLPSAANLETIARDSCDRVARWLVETTLSPRDGFSGRIQKMAATLGLWGAHTNLTADAADPAEIAFHVIDSLAPIAFATGDNRHALEDALAEGATALDLGSGAGFPGLVLAAAFEARFTLSEARRKRASYLQVAAHQMELRNVGVEPRRSTARTVVQGLYDLVTARAFGTSPELYEIAGAALRPGGIFLLYATGDQSAGQADDSYAHATHFAPPASWTYEVPHGDRIATRMAVLWRKPPVSNDA